MYVVVVVLFSAIPKSSLAITDCAKTEPHVHTNGPFKTCHIEVFISVVRNVIQRYMYLPDRFGSSAEKSAEGMVKKRRMCYKKYRLLCVKLGVTLVL